MVKVISLRLLQAFMLAIFVNTLCFLMMQILPGNQAMRIAAGRYGPDGMTAEIAQSVALELGLYKPLWQQYWDSLVLLFNFDLGYSLVSGEKVIHEIQTQLGYSLYLAFFSFVLTLLIAFPLGIFSGAKSGGIIDKISMVFSVLLKAIPPFLLGLLLMIVFSLYLKILPPAGFENWTYLILPAFTLALGLSAVSNRLIRESMIDVSNASYYSYAKYKGLSNFRIIKNHGIKNALIPIVSFLALQSIYLIEGVVIVESIFAFPGIGHALVHAIIARDIPMIQGSVLIMGLLFVSINLLADILSQFLDPRLGAKHVK